MKTQTEALKLALEAAYLAGFNASGEGYNGEYPFQDNDVRPEKDDGWVRGRDNRINAIKEALAQPEQEPVAWMHPSGGVVQRLITGFDRELYTIPLYTTPPQPKEPEQRSVSEHLEPDVYIPADALRQLKGTSLLILRSVPLYGYRGDGLTPLYTTPPQRKPQFKEFIKWAGAQGYDCAQTCNSDTGEWIVLNPMTADLWKAWQAAHGIKE